jgi:hypothetical protein
MKVVKKGKGKGSTVTLVEEQDVEQEAELTTKEKGKGKEVATSSPKRSSNEKEKGKGKGSTVTLVEEQAPRSPKRDPRSQQAPQLQVIITVLYPCYNNSVCNILY